MDYAPATRYGVPALVGVILGWLTFRLLQYPPFVEFLIATEAEMNKVSWTTKADLYRATIVVLATVFIVAVYLFGVDELWSHLLQMIGVLRFSGDGAFGSQAG
jgi:preprotein translocase subunit SecE